jgi:hypothetical protein
MTGTKLNAKVSLFAHREKITTDALGEEHPSTSILGEEDFAALATGEEKGRGGPFGAF